MSSLIALLRTRLDSTPPCSVQDDDHRRSAVAMLLRPGDQGEEVFFIERAAHIDDPWSGNLAFPGGKVEAGDPAPRDAAERETREEVGIDLRQAEYLGFLTEITGAQLPVRVACFVYLLSGPPPMVVPNREIADTLWVPITVLTAPERRIQTTVTFAGHDHQVPAIRLPQPGKPVLWGLTYRLLQYLFSNILEEPCVRSSPS